MLLMERKTKKQEKKAIEDYSLDELKTLNGSRLELEDAEQLDFNPLIIRCDKVGYSADHLGYVWLDYTLIDDTHIDIVYYFSIFEIDERK